MVFYTGGARYTGDTNGWSTKAVNQPEDDLGTYAITHRFAVVCPVDAFPTGFSMLDSTKFALGFSNGTIRVVKCASVERAESDGLEDAALVVEVDAHEVTRGPRNTTLLNSTWSSRAPGGHQVEFISAGGTKRGIKVWGLRLSTPTQSKDGSVARMYSLSGVESLADVPVDSMGYALDELGSYEIVQEPYSKVQSKAVLRIRVGKFNIITYDLKTASSSNPLRRELMCALGGKLAFLEVHQPFCNVHAYKAPRKIVASCIGPCVSHFQRPSTGSYVSSGGDDMGGTAVILRSECVDVLDSSNGTVIREFGTMHLPDEFKPQLGSVGRDSNFNSEMREREGRPTAVYWDHLNSVIMIGYATGGTGILRPNSEAPVIKLDTLQAHNSSIRLYKTFYQHIINRHNEHQFNSMMLVGDESGVVSIWRLQKKKYSLIKRYEAHNGAIVYMDSISGYNEEKKNTSGIEKVLLTACSGGLVKAWVQDKTSGELMMTAFFKTSSSMMSFLPILLINSASSAALEKRSTMEGSLGAAQNTVESLDGSVASDAAPSEFTVHVMCLCGLKSGLLEGWVMSTEGEPDMNTSQFPGANVLKPLWTLPCHDAAICSVTRMRGIDEGLMETVQYQAMCSSVFGTSVVLQLGPRGQLTQQPKFFTLPIVAKDIIPYVYEAGNSDAPVYDEFLVVGEQRVVEICPSTRFDISSRWSAVHSGHLPTVYRESTAPLDNDDASRMSDNVLSSVVSVTDVVSQSGNASVADSLDMSVDFDEVDERERTGNEGNREQPSSAFDLSYSDDQFIEIAGKNTLYSETMESMERAVTSDLFFAKKDPKLINLYIQAKKVGAGDTVDADSAIDIVHSWLASPEVAKEVVWETMLLLGIKKENLLSFIRIAKIAALTAAVVKRQTKETLASLGVAVDKKADLWGDYHKLRTTKTVVTYNAFGEPKVETMGMRRGVAGGLPKGNDLALTRSMATIDGRLMESYVGRKKQTTATMLDRIPPKFVKHFNNKFLEPVILPTMWDSNNQHWFDLRRAVRVARTILDMRSTKQHEKIVGEDPVEGTKVDGMPRLTCLYFERSFGHGRLNVSNHKIVHFLEACLQYRQCPVMHFLQLFLCPKDKSEEPSEIALWVYVELRHLLYSKGVVEDGEVIPSVDTLDEMAGTSKESASMRWQLISRNEAISIIDEMFRVRGKYGVQCLQRLYQALDSVPDTQFKDISKSMIDVEVFLYIITLEFNKIEQLLKEVDSSLFDVRNVPMYRVASARDIYNDISERVPVNHVARKANITLSLDRIRELACQFVYHDPRRLGTVDQITFRSVIVVAGQAILAFECGRDAHSLVDLCQKKFRDHEIDGSMCYTDFLAALLAYVVQDQGGSHGLDGDSAKDAIMNMNIGIGEKEAISLMLFVGLQQCPPPVDQFWVVRPSKVENKGSIETSGDWVVRPPKVEVGDKSLQDKGLGSLAVISQSVPYGSTESKEQPGLEVRQLKERMQESSFSYVPERKGTMTTSISNEIISLKGTFTNKVTGKLTNSPKRPKAVTKLTLNDMSMASKVDNALEAESSVLQKTAPELYNQFLNSSSYSGSLKKHVDADFSRSVEMGKSDSFHQLSELQPEHFAGQQQLEGKQWEQVQVSLPMNANESRAEDGTYLRDKIASDEVDRRRALMTMDEQELLRSVEMEQERFAKRRAAKLAKSAKGQAEARAKERMAMRFKAKEDNRRQKRFKAGLELEERALTAQRMDTNAAYEEKMRKKEEEKERVRLIKVAREEEEAAARGKEREVTEGIEMRAQEKAKRAYDLALKEKEEKEAAANAEKAAKEAAIAAEKRAKEIAEEEARAAAAAAKAEEEAKELEEVNRRRDYKDMKKEDFNVLSIPTEAELAAAAVEEEARAKAEAEEAALASDVEGEGEGEEEEEEDDDDTPFNRNAEVEEDRVYTKAELRFVDFLGKMKGANARHTQHPRNEDGGKFFAPMLFSNDIQYDNFAGGMNDESGRLSAWDVDEIGTIKFKEAPKISLEIVESNGAFADVAQKVKEHKLQMIRERLENLYRTSSSEESPAEWTEVMKKNYVDWASFFEVQQGILTKRPDTPPPPIDHEGNFLAKVAAMAEALKNEPDEDSMLPLSLRTLTVPQTLPVPKDADIEEAAPLPLGKVSRDYVLPQIYKYYQVEVVDPYATITFEIKSTRGYADIYLSTTEVLPTVTNHEFQAMSGDHNARIARLIYKPTTYGTVMLGVHSPLGAQYELWAFASGHIAEPSEHIMKVSQNLRRWEIIQNHSIEEMETRLPEIIHTADGIVEFENSMAVPSILADYRKHVEEEEAKGIFQKPRQSQTLILEEEAGADESKAAGDAQAPTQTDDGEDSDDEIATMDNFIAKAGRRLIRKDLLEGKGHITDLLKAHRAEVDEDGDEIDYIDPNSHVELFKRPVLTSTQTYMDIVGREPRLSYEENVNFTTLSIHRRKQDRMVHSQRAAPHPMSMSLPNLGLDMSSSLHGHMNMSGAEGSMGRSTSLTQKPFKLPKRITGATKKVSYSLHRTEKFHKNPW